MAKGVGDVLYSILSNDTNVSSVVGTKIYPFLAIEDVVYPYIVYTIEGVEPTQTDDGVSPLDVNGASIEIYSETLEDIETLSKYVRNALDRYQGTVEGIVVQSASFQSEDGGYADEDRVYLKIQTYSLRMITISACFNRVTDLAAASVSDTAINLTWTDVATGETGYEVWTSQDFINWTLVATTAADASSYSVTGLTAQTSYSYKIRAVDSTDCGEWSNIVIGCTETVVTPKVGIAYDRTYRTLQGTSYAVYDDGWQEANGGYDFTELTNPLHCQKLDFATDSTGVTLLYDNAFGNKFRYTYDDGTFMPFTIPSLEYGIDNLTGLGHLFGDISVATWNNTYGVGGYLEGLNTAVTEGFSDWFMANIRMIEVLGKNGGGSGEMYNCPYFGGTYSDRDISSSSIAYVSTTHRFYSKQVGSATAANTTSTFRVIPTRLHFK